MVNSCTLMQHKQQNDLPMDGRLFRVTRGLGSRMVLQAIYLFLYCESYAALHQCQMQLEDAALHAPFHWFGSPSFAASCLGEASEWWVHLRDYPLGLCHFDEHGPSC